MKKKLIALSILTIFVISSMWYSQAGFLDTIKGWFTRSEKTQEVRPTKNNTQKPMREEWDMQRPRLESQKIQKPERPRPQGIIQQPDKGLMIRNMDKRITPDGKIIDTEKAREHMRQCEQNENCIKRMEYIRRQPAEFGTRPEKFDRLKELNQTKVNRLEIMEQGIDRMMELHNKLDIPTDEVQSHKEEVQRLKQAHDILMQTTTQWSGMENYMNMKKQWRDLNFRTKQLWEDMHTYMESMKEHVDIIRKEMLMDTK